MSLFKLNYIRYYLPVMLCCVFCSAAAQNDLKLNFKKSIVCAGIEVGSRGVKLSVIEIYQKNKKASAYQVLKDTSINTDFISFTPATFKATLTAVAELYHKVHNQYAITADRVFTAFSSGVSGQAQKNNTLSQLQLLADSIKTLLNEPLRKITIIDVKDEARLSHLGIVPEERRYSTFLIDIGSGNSKGGYFPFGTTDDFKLFQLNWGTKSISNATDARLQEDVTISNYQKQLSRVLAGAVDKDVIYAVNESGAYNMSDYVAISGGIAWSVANLLYPELINNTVVPVTYEEVEKLSTMLVSNYIQLSADALVKNVQQLTTDKEKIKKELSLVHQVFDQKALMAGTGLLLKIMRQFKGVHEGKEFYLVKNGQVGWISAFVNEQSK